MVKTRDVHDIHNDSHVDIEKWVAQVGNKLGLPADQLHILRSALELSLKTSQNGVTDQADQRPSAFLTGMEMAEILSDLGLDDEGLTAAILYRHVREGRLSLKRSEERRVGKECRARRGQEHKKERGYKYA